MIVLPKEYIAVQNPTAQAIKILGRDWAYVELMPYRTSFIVTDTDDVDSYRDASDWADRGMTLFASHAGGSMCFRGSGKYQSRKGLIPESIHLIECFYESAQAQLDGLPEISRFLRDMHRERRQQSIGMKLNSSFVLLY